MAMLSWLLLFAVFCHARIVCCEESALDTVPDVPGFPEIKWYYVPRFIIQHSREDHGRVLSIQCQSHTLCGMKRMAESTSMSTAPITQYCDCPEGEECRKISVIEPLNFTYYRCMDVI